MNVLTRRFGERERERGSLMRHLKPEGSSCPESEQQPNKEMLARMRLADASTAHTLSSRLQSPRYAVVYGAFKYDVHRVNTVTKAPKRAFEQAATITTVTEVNKQKRRTGAPTAAPSADSGPNTGFRHA